MPDEPAAFVQYINTIPDDQRDLVKATRDAVIYALPELKETIKWNNLFFVYPPSENVAAIVAHKDHINLQFAKGNELDDPRGKLEGDGKQMRHIKIYSEDDIDGDYWGALLRQQFGK